MILATQPVFMPALAEIFVSVGAIKVLLLGLLSKKNSVRWCFNYAVITLLAAALALFSQPLGLQITFNGLFTSDAFSITMKMVVVLTGAVVLILTRLTAIHEGLNHFEYPALVLFAIVGMMIMISAHDLISLFMGLELQSLSLYILVGMRRKNSESSEAALKYFILGALSTGILLYGCSLIYGFTALTNFEMLERFFKNQPLTQNLPIGPIIGMVFIIIALGFKIATAPFHLWVPDVYQGTSTSLTTFLVTAPKAAGLAVFMKILMNPFGGLAAIWQPLLIILAVSSMAIGCLSALTQTNLKRLLAYSSIGHIGFSLIGILVANKMGLEATLIYNIFYLLAMLLFFGAVLSLQRQGKLIENLADLKGINRMYPGVSFLLGFTLFSLAGLPPLPGFIPKLLVLRAAVTSGYYILSIFAVIYSLICAAYYLLIIKAMFLEGTAQGDVLVTPAYRKRDLSMILVLLGVTIALTVLLVYPNFLLDIVYQAIVALLYL